MVLCQVCSNNRIPCRTPVAMATKMKIFKNLVQNHKAQRFGILYVPSIIQWLFKLTPGVKKGPGRVGPQFYIMLYRKKSLTLLHSNAFAWFPAPSILEGAGNQAMVLECKRFKNLLVRNHNAQSLDIQHVVSSGSSLQRLYK